ncbi:ABC-2 type transport system ATP-binding protein [Enhydrobacter aerosaccus]|uniref:ABC-2 type transport system ATP-binding protein n=1 Tax=Enhydrobacter aerosaccus TaxID=225324 RepID=A0A1T4KT54_9HYPH|nr:ABC transporter ATP-binding protein [Enhydrobacter aerosaccus]SJZ45591.1 ABC-2 type transport system ATP-binding protein [Enhydrobacter aerosaccus]
MSDNVIEAHGLTKAYGAARAVNAIDLTVRRGEIFGLLGPNGAGKTTTILMLLGLTETSSGTVSVLGFDPVRQPLEVKRRVGYLPDAVGFYDHLTARENLTYTARLLDIPRRETDGRIMEALQSVELADVVDKRVATFSRGMRQRLGIAEIVMKKAEVAILDEPTSGLDPHATFELLEMIRRLKKSGVAVLLSSHLLDRVQSVCDRVALFNRGKIALMGTVVELANQVLGAGHPLLVEATGTDVAATLRGIPGVQQVVASGDGAWRVIADRDVRAEAAQRIITSGGALTRLADLQPSLEEVYTRYFQEARHAA